MTEAGADTATIHVQLGEIKGILSTIVQEHARRLDGQEAVTRQLRVDLTAVNAELTTKINSVHTEVTKNTANISDIRSDVAEVKGTQNAALPRAAQIMSPIVAVGSLIWAVVIGSR